MRAARALLAHGSARTGRTVRAIAPDDPENGSQRRRHPRQRQLAHEADRRARSGRHRTHRRGSNQFGRRPRCPAERPRSADMDEDPTCATAKRLPDVHSLLRVSRGPARRVRRCRSSWSVTAPRRQSSTAPASTISAHVVRGLAAVHRPSVVGRQSCRWGCRGSVRISGSIRSRRPFSASSISARSSASLYALGYGRHEAEPARVLPVLSRLSRGHESRGRRRRRLQLPIRLGAHVARVVGAGDGPSSRSKEQRYAGFVYLIMASFGTFALLFAFGLLAGAHGDYAFDAIRAHPPLARPGGACACPGGRRRRLEGGPGAACTSGCRSRTRPRRAMSRR